jgi:hypothetical protein
VTELASDGRLRDHRTGTSPIFGQPQPAVVEDREPAVLGEPDGLPVVLARPEAGRCHRAALALAGDRGEEGAVRNVQVGEGLLQDDGRDLARPLPLRGVLGLGDDPLGKVAVRQVLLARVAGLLTQAQPVVEHHAGAPE